MDEHKDIIKNDPVYTIGFNDGLEYSVRWIEDSAKGRAFDDATIPEFVALNAISLRLAKEPVNQQDFYDALRVDPEMYEKLRAEVERLRKGFGDLIEFCESLITEDELIDDYAKHETATVLAIAQSCFSTAALNPFQNGNGSVGDMTNGVGEGEEE